MKNITQLLLIGIFLIVLVNCASIHQRYEALPADPGAPPPELAVSSEENRDLSSEYFGEVNFTFENKTKKWIRIKKVSLDFNDPVINKAIRIPIGADLVAWAKAAQHNKEIHDYNTALVLGSAMALGAGIALSNGNPTIHSAGAVTLVGSTLSLATLDLLEQKNRLRSSGLVPDSHLLSDEFVVPPGLHTMKWITFYTENPHSIPYISKMQMTLTMEDGHQEKIDVPFRTYASSWQNFVYKNQSP